MENRECIELIRVFPGWRIAGTWGSVSQKLGWSHLRIVGNAQWENQDVAGEGAMQRWEFSGNAIPGQE